MDDPRAQKTPATSIFDTISLRIITKKQIRIEHCPTTAMKSFSQIPTTYYELWC